MAALDDLKTAYSNLAARLKEITANPKPTYTIDGESIDWLGYQTMIITQLGELGKRIQEAGGPFEIRTRRTT